MRRHEKREQIFVCSLIVLLNSYFNGSNRVKSFKKRNTRLLTAFPNNYGYWRVALTNPFGISKRLLVSRLVATAFYEKPNEE